MFRWIVALCATMLLAGSAFGDERFRVYNNTDVELKVVILHSTLPLSWRETIDIGKAKPRLGPSGPVETLADGVRILIVTDPITGAVYHTSNFTTVPGGGRRIKLTGSAPNIALSYALIPPGAVWSD